MTIIVSYYCTRVSRLGRTTLVENRYPFDRPDSLLRLLQPNHPVNFNSFLPFKSLFFLRKN